MKKYRVLFEIWIDKGSKIRKSIDVEAGNKKVATLRAMGEINRLKEYEGLYKNVTGVEEVSNSES